MNFAGGLGDRDDDVLMFAAVDADRSSGAGTFDVQRGVDLVAVGAIDNNADRTDNYVCFRGKELRAERRNGLFAVLYEGIRVAVKLPCRRLVAAFRGKVLTARNGRRGCV